MNLLLMNLKGANKSIKLTRIHGVAGGVKVLFPAGWKSCKLLRNRVNKANIDRSETKRKRKMSVK